MTRILKKIEKTLFSRKTHTLDVTPLWFLNCREETLRTDPTIDAETLELFLDLRRNGFAILKDNVPPELCDSVVADFDEYCARHPEANDYRDEYGLHSRLALFHYKSKKAMQVAMRPRTVKFLRAAFRKEFTIVGSLYFEKGSTQDIHRDTPAFFTNPLNHFFGVWNALEDIKENSGELCYYRGGHNILPDADLYSRNDINIDNYFSAVENACQKAGLDRELFLPKKGDTLIWLPQLPHGGAPRLDKTLSRRSIVFHFIPNGVPIHGATDFFDPTKAVHVGENYSVKSVDGVRTIDMGETRFYHNRSEGNFTEG